MGYPFGYSTIRPDSAELFATARRITLEWFGAWLSLARAPGSGPGGRWFESTRPDQLNQYLTAKHQLRSVGPHGQAPQAFGITGPDLRSDCDTTTSKLKAAWGSSDKDVLLSLRKELR